MKGAARLLLLVLPACRPGADPPRDPDAGLEPTPIRSQAERATVLHGDTLILRVAAVIEPDEPPRLLVRATIENPGRNPVELHHGDCPLRVRLHRTDGEERQAWDSAVLCTACTLQLHTPRIPPGGSLSPDPFEMRSCLPRLKGDTVPPGTYRLSAELEVQRAAPGSPPDTLQLPELVLELPDG